MKVYINYKQKQFLYGKQNIKVLIGSRGTGKTFVLGAEEYKNIKYLPGGRGFLSSTTFAQLLTKSLPEMQSFWTSVGLKEYESEENPGHYIIGKRPPRWFNAPIKKPKKYTNIISFFNGYHLELLSMDRPDLARGGSYDTGSIDEAALVPKDHIDKVLLPSMRGNRHKFAHTPFHRQLRLVSSMPWKPSGRYLFDYEIKSQNKPDTYLYIEASAMDNIHVLGQDTIDLMREEMDPFIFEVEIMNRRVNWVQDGFYHKLDPDKHTFTPRYIYKDNDDGMPVSVEGIEDIDKDALLEMSFDFSGSFSGVVVLQERKGTEYAFWAGHAKNGKSLLDLVDEVCERYNSHNFKFVRIWGEPRGHDTQALQGVSTYESIKKRFLKNGWGCEVKAHAGRTTTHAQRYLFVNKILEESNKLLPKLRMNNDGCKNLIIAMQLAQTKEDFKKDKSSERNKYFPQEHATHFTDIIDYYLVQKHGHKEVANVPTGGRVNFL